MTAPAALRFALAKVAGVSLGVVDKCISYVFIAYDLHPSTLRIILGLFTLCWVYLCRGVLDCGAPPV